MTQSSQAHPNLTRREAVGCDGAADTTLLLEDLKRRYKRGNRALDVSFRELVSWVRQGDQLTHQIHPYPAKLLPHIAHFFVNASILRRGSAVLDPFAGSGTVALEASLADATALVADANPLAALITKVKTTPYDSTALVESAQRLSRRVARFRIAPTVPVVNEHLWYFQHTKQDLERLLRGIHELDDDQERDFFRVCFSVTARRLSLADPSISVPVRLGTKERLSATTNKAVKAHLQWIRRASVLEEFGRVVQANIGRVAAANRVFPQRRQSVTAGNDARSLTLDGLPMRSETVHLTITSPPYGSAQKYVRSCALALNWLSLCSPSGLSALEGKSIGREHLPAKQGAPEMNDLRLPVSLRRTLSQVLARNPHRAAITETYLYELQQAMKELVRVTAANGHAVIVVGNNTVAGLPLRNDEFIAATLKDLGLDLELCLRDRIHSRGLLTTRNPTAGLIAGETVMLFRKP
ncbi:hypothetical protein C1M51_00895 [Methylibium sp. Pch-M]|uniref:hypothetical protein n=1 Tax=Methylibium sp. Pch-M TaxID=2082386 RepID=UPI001012AF87|nr:hypothetical protein [Methylibium sp. Pch-M]QAZ38094.1 hypothetical protein C1M51_00895 [Methylibium sp. Pch-M]